MVDNKIEEYVGLAATKIAKDIGASGLITIEQKKAEEGLDENNLYLDVLVTIFKKVKENTYTKQSYSTKIKKTTDGSIIPIKELLMEAIGKRYISKGDLMVCVVDESVGMGYKSLMFVFEVDKVLFNISTHNLAENINPNVIETVMEIALEIGREGREDKRIGTGFIVGDKSEILKYTKQLIINPFSAYPDESKNILDPVLRETIKEFAQLDGVFIINKDGTIVSCGTYLDIDTRDINLHHGFGTRHRNTAALTKETNAIGVVVSQSGGKVTIFKDGKAVMRL
jgi:DNA integrity scanning protein DisA with diadenylate cyclase activity